MAQNVTNTSQTKHVDIRYKFVNKYVEDRIVKIIFVKSKENNANIPIKNLNRELHATHSLSLLRRIKVCWDNDDTCIWVRFPPIQNHMRK